MVNRSVAVLETTRRHRFSADDYHRMDEAGVFPPDDRRYELLDGEVLVMGPIGVRHSGCVVRLNHEFSALGSRAVVSVQGPLRLDDHSEPLPDLMLLCPPVTTYDDRHPTAADVLLLVEVADSSLAFDQREKLPRYAAAGVREFWLIDLKTNRVEIHREPDGDTYREKRTFMRGDTVTPTAFPDHELSVDDLLP